MIHSLLASVILVVAPTPCTLTACSCSLLADVGQGVRQAVDWTDAIFEGRVLSAADTTLWRVSKPGGRPRKHQLRLVTLDVQRAWKGAASDTLRLLGSIGVCQYPFQQGEVYVVFANRLEGITPPGDTILSTSICTYTVPASQADTVRAALGPPRRDRGD